MSKFFINRPIFSWVIAILVMMGGVASIVNLPIAQFPEIAPPQIAINSSYPGANALTVENTVTQVIEQRLTGLDGFRYMSSESDSFGNSAITVSFEQGTNPDIAQVQVQNRVQQAMPLLPQIVQQQGVNVEQTSTSFLVVVSFYSDDGSLDQFDIADYVASNIQDPLSRLSGVGNIQLFGAQYSMRIWLDPEKLHNYGLTPSDVVQALREQNAQVPAGRLGAAPAVNGQQLNVTVTSQSLLETPEQFEQILLRVLENGARIQLKDVATIEIGGQNYLTSSSFNGHPAVGLAVSLASGANALDTDALIRSELDQMAKNFPEGLKLGYAYETTPFVEISLRNVATTLMEAVILVFIVMYLFLRNFRATIIPTFSIPVVMLGVFIILFNFGFIINTLTMFALVLAIGLLVDDAIIVVENTERLMTDEGLSPKEAAIKSMSQITGALVGIGVVLSAIFLPMAFIGGSVGVIYRQFAITIVTAMTLSVIVALFFTPSLCATILRHKKDTEIPKGFTRVLRTLFLPVSGLVNAIVSIFNRGFDRFSGGYAKIVAKIVLAPFTLLLIFGGLMFGLYSGFSRMSPAFLPDEDQGIMIGLVLGPNNSTLAQTQETLTQLENYFKEHESQNVRSFFGVAGFSFLGRAENVGVAFITLKDWSERTAQGQDVFSISQRASGFIMGLKNTAFIPMIVPPAIIELGVASGFEFRLQDRAGLGMQTLQQSMGALLQAANQDSRFSNLRPNGLPATDQFIIDIDHEKARAFGVSISEINNTLSIAWGGLYVNDFIDRGRIKRVMLQGNIDSRMQPEDLSKWYVRNQQGQMVSFDNFASGHWSVASPRLERFNGFPALSLQGAAAEGVSTGEAMLAIEELARELLPAGIGIEWYGLSYEERQASTGTGGLYILASVVMLLALAALYESWSVPVSILAVVPLGVVGAVAAARLFGIDNDVYFQVGLLTTIGLTAKNAILIVEFAKSGYESGKPLVEATLEACRLRLRPIVMTSMAFVFGVLPLALSTGAGHAAQNVVGRIVIGGMLGATLLVILFVPLFYIMVTRITSRRKA